MKAVLAALVALAAPALAADTAPVSTQSSLPPGVWAVVDSRTITKDEVEKKTKLLPPNVPAELAPALVLEGLIDEVITANGLDRDGVGPSSVPESEITKLVNDQREAAKRMGDDFDARLKQSGVTLEELTAKIRIALAFKKRVERDATDEALKAWFAKHELELAGEMRARHVFIAARGDDTATFQRALQVLARVKADGSNMAELARTLSEDVNAPLDSGDTDWFGGGAGSVPPEVAEACFALGKKGLVPRPVRSRRGYHVVYVTGTRFTQPSSFERHVEQVRQRFLMEHAQELRKAWRAAAHVEVAADAPKMPR